MPEKNMGSLWFRDQLMYWDTNINNRKMPWKGETNPYKIWLSEIILQQTRVEQGLKYYQAFVKEFPSITDLAEAKEQRVFKLWEGLGYYSRCRNLIATAKYISAYHKGIFPTEFDQILALKGVGPYTAAAIASFAFNLPYAVLDGNVYRVLSRFFGNSIPIDTSAGKKEFGALAQQLLDRQMPAIYNQAIMDFGATVCTPKLAKCNECILSKKCVGYQTGSLYQLPIKSKKLAIGERWFYYFIIKNKGKIWVRERLGKDIWKNLHEFYLLEVNKSEKIPQLLKKAGLSQYTQLKVIALSEPYQQKLTHLKINASFIELEIANLSNLPGYKNISLKQLRGLPFPKIINSFMKDKNYL